MMADVRAQNWRNILTLGLLAGGLVLYAGAVGMIALFHEREIIDDFITLGQLILFIAPFLAALAISRQLREQGESMAAVVGGGAITGFLTALPSIIMLLFNSDDFRFLLDYSLRLIPFAVASYVAWRAHRHGGGAYRTLGVWLLTAALVGVVTGSLALIFDVKGDLRSVLVNIDRDWVDVITFDRRKELLSGIVVYGLVSVGAGAVGAVFYIIPETSRAGPCFMVCRRLCWWASLAKQCVWCCKRIWIGDVLSAIFRRDTIRQSPALILFAVSTIFGLLWARFGQRIRADVEDRVSVEHPRTRVIGAIILIAILLALPWTVGRTLSDVAVTIGLVCADGAGP